MEGEGEELGRFLGVGLGEEGEHRGVEDHVETLIQEGLHETDEGKQTYDDASCPATGTAREETKKYREKKKGEEEVPEAVGKKLLHRLPYEMDGKEPDEKKAKGEEKT